MVLLSHTDGAADTWWADEAVCFVSVTPIWNCIGIRLSRSLSPRSVIAVTTGRVDIMSTSCVFVNTALCSHRVYVTSETGNDQLLYFVSAFAFVSIPVYRHQGVL